nr:hypothetical protein [Tanacetum cinerariifolium]
IIMAHQQLVADVHPDKLCPPNKRKELSLTLEDFRTIFHLPQATDNNHDRFVPQPSFYDMIPFYKNHLGFTMELKTPSSFKITSLLQPWQTLCNISSKCLTTRSSYGKEFTILFFIPHLRFLIQGKYKDKVGMKIPDWMITEAMKQTEHYTMYAEHLASKEIEKIVEGQEHVVDDSSIPRNDEHNIPGTREKGKNVEEYRITPFPTPIRSPRIHTNLVSSDTEKLLELTELQGRYGYLFEHLRAKFMPRKSFVTLADHLHESMADSLPTMVDKHIKEQVPEQVRNQVPIYVAEGLILERKKNKKEMEKMIAKAMLQEPQPQTTFVPEQQYQLTPAIRLRDQDDPHDDAHPEGENSAKRQKTSEYEAYVSRESSSGQE